MTKSILSLGIEKQYSHKVSFENMLSTYMFSPEAALPQVFDITERLKSHTGLQLQTPALLLDMTLLDDDMSCSGIAHFSLL